MESYSIDPLCKLITSTASDDSSNEHDRFCSKICASSYFSDDRMAKYSLITATLPCQSIEISFRTLDGIKSAAEETYRELMAPCLCRFLGSIDGLNYLYISRAYVSNQILVYNGGHMDGRIYLENLSTHVSIVDEINSFDFVEE